jgi:hypothetical protein
LIVLAVLTIPASKALGDPDPTAEHDDVSMALIEAMEYAVGADPSIRLAEQFRISSFGVVEQNAGPFNTKLGFKFSYDGGRSYLNEAQLHGENQKRTLFRELALITQQVADDLQEQLGGEDFVWADCPEGLDITIGDTPRSASQAERRRFSSSITVWLRPSTTKNWQTIWSPPT